MSYATLTDVTARYRPIITMIGSEQFDVASVEVTSVFIASAESMVDAYVGARYAVPVSPVPPLITQVTADLAIHAMLAEKSPSVPESIDKRYERCMKILEDLRDGKMVLPSSVALVTSGDSYAWSNNMDHHSIFDPALDYIDQNVDKQRVDEQKVLREPDGDIDCD